MEQIASLKIITKGAGIVFFGFLLSKLLTFFYRIFIANTYTVTDYGLFAEGLAVITLLKAFVMIGLPTAIIRYTAFYNARRDKEGVRGVLVTSLKITAPLSIIMSLVLYAFSDYIAISVFGEPGLVSFMHIFALSLPFFCITFVFSYFFIGIKMVKYQIYIKELLPNFLKLLFVAAFWMFGLGVIGIPLSWTAAMVLVFVASLFLLERSFPFFKKISDFKNLDREILAFSLPLFLSSIVAVLMNWMDTIALGIFKNADFVGVYNAALPLAQLLLMAPLAFSTLFMPIITEYHSLKKFNLVRRINKIVVKWIFYANLVIFLPLVFFSQQIITFFFGPEYAGGWVALSILATGFLINSFAHTAGGILSAIKKTRYMMINSVVAVTFNVLLNIILVPVYGLMGAATATVVSLILIALMPIAEVWYIKGISPFSVYLPKGLFAGSLSISAVFALYRLFFFGPSPLLFVVFFGFFCILYGFLLLIFGCFEKEDIEILKAIRRKTGLNLTFASKIIQKFLH